MNPKSGSLKPLVLLLGIFILSRILYLFFHYPNHFSTFPLEERYIGPSLFVLKLAPILLVAGALCLWHQIVSRFFSEGVARLFTLLFIFSPPSFTQFSVISLSWGHASFFFATLSVALFLNIFSGKLQNRLPFLFAGVAAGTSLGFSTSNLVLLVAIFIFGFARRKEWALKNCGYVFLGFVLGFFPWMIVTERSASFAQYFRFGLSSIEFFDGQNFVGYGLLYTVPMLGALLTLLKKKTACDKRSLSPAFFFFVLWSALYFSLAQVMPSLLLENFFPVYPVLFLFVAVALYRLENSVMALRFKSIPIFLILLIVLTGLSHVPVH